MKDTAYENIVDVLERELNIIIVKHALAPERLSVRVEQLRLQIAMLARVLDDALNGSKTALSSPERAADAVFKLVTLLRELPRSR